MSADLRTDELEDANLIHPPTISNVGGFADRDPPPAHSALALQLDQLGGLFRALSPISYHVRVLSG